MAANWQRGVMRLMRIANHPAEVIGVEDFTPWYRRITFRAPAVAEAVEVFPTVWLRLWVPHPAKGDDFVVQRGYTFVTVDAAAETFSLEFVLHDVAGPAGDWAKNVRIGAQVEVALTPARIDIPDGTTTLVLAGDTTALPAINSWLAAVPDEITTRVFLEDDHSDREALPREVRARGTWEWVTREGGRGAALAQVMRESLAPDAGIYAWAAGEKTLVKNVRTVLRDHLALDRAHQFTQFYWIEGKSNG